MKLGSLFQDGAVFQRNKALSVWGNTAPKTLVKASFGGNETYARAAGDGSFQLRLPPMGAGGPYELTVTNLDNGESVAVRDILVGEVWLASGQSNMEYQLGSDWEAAGRKTPGQPSLNERQRLEYCEGIADGSNIRFFTVAKKATGVKETDADGAWEYMTAENAPRCTAVGAWFARYVQEALDVPVGIIHSSWGGTIAEAWTSRNALLQNPVTSRLPCETDKNLADREIWDQLSYTGEINFAKVTTADRGNSGYGDGWASLDFDDIAWTRLDIPGSWIDQGIGGNGALWARFSVTIPANWSGHGLTLHLGGVDKHDITYFNGVEVGRSGKDFETDYWNAPRAYSVPASCVKAGERNVIAIRAYSFLYQGAFWGRPENYSLVCEATGESLPLNGAWRARMEYDLGIRQLTAKVKAYGPSNPNTPAILFDAMIHPLLTYGIAGVIWYQGESNAHTVQDAENYRTLLGNMIRDWRYQWGLGDFPFIQVQLAAYRVPMDYEDGAWAKLRESQRLCCQDQPEVYMISAVDLGDCDDIHPQDKKNVGLRLAQNALYHVYGRQDIVPSGPMFLRLRQEGHEIRVFFDFADGLRLADGGGSRSFYIADIAGHFFPADVIRVEGSTVVLSSKDVPTPNAVRYAWATNPTSTLYNGAGLPASPFSASI